MAQLQATASPRPEWPVWQEMVNMGRGSEERLRGRSAPLACSYPPHSHPLLPLLTDQPQPGLYPATLLLTAWKNRAAAEGKGGQAQTWGKGAGDRQQEKSTGAKRHAEEGHMAGGRQQDKPSTDIEGQEPRKQGVGSGRSPHATAFSATAVVVG